MREELNFHKRIMKFIRKFKLNKQERLELYTLISSANKSKEELQSLCDYTVVFGKE